MNIQAARGRILVKKLPRYSGLENKLNLKLVDGKKHYDGVRRGVVESVGAGVQDVSVGDVVVFRGDAGFTFDYDPDSELQDAENSYHWLREPDCLAVEENVLQEA